MVQKLDEGEFMEVEKVEEACVRNVKLYRCPIIIDEANNDEENDTIPFVLKVNKTTPYMQPHTTTGVEFIELEFSLAALSMPIDVLQPNIYAVLEYVFSQKTSLCLSQEAASYINSCYDFSPCSEDGDFSLVLFVEVDRIEDTNKDNVVAMDYDRVCDDYMDKVVEYAKKFFGIPRDDVDFYLMEDQSKLAMGHGNDDQTECAICLTKFTGGQIRNCSEIVSLGCGHVFHKQCVFRWLARNPSCPLCRTNTITSIDIC